MLKAVFTQLFNQRRRNGWLLVELSLVFCLVWYMVDYFFVVGYNSSLPSYLQTAHTWQVEIGELPATHPDYQHLENDSLAREANFVRVMERLKAWPDVEAVSVSFQGGLIGSGMFLGKGIRNAQDSTRTVYTQVVGIDPRYDYLRVFRFSSGQGKRYVSSGDYDWGDPHAALLCSWGAARIFSDGRAVGKEVTTIPWKGQTDVFRVKGVVDPTKRFTYERPRALLLLPLRAHAGNIARAEIAVRSRENLSDALFLENFKPAMFRALRIGNFYLRNVRPVGKIGEQTAYAFGFTGEYHVRMGLMFFFLLNILLCVMGAFWYRIRLRREETGLRMAVGATRLSVRNLFLTEGICLLTLAMLPALFVEAQFVYAGLQSTLGRTEATAGMYLPDHTALRFILTNLLTWLFLALVILLAVWLPARKAAQVAPAIALHEE